MGRPKRIFTMRDTLKSYLDKNGELAYRIKSQEALAAWDRVVDEYVKAHSSSALVKDGMLFVHTDSAALANELAMREDELRAKLNEALRMPVVRRILFKSGFIRKEGAREKKVKTKVKKLTLKTLNRIDEAVRPIEDDNLKFILRKLLVTAAMRDERGGSEGA